MPAAAATLAPEQPPDQMVGAGPYRTSALVPSAPAPKPSRLAPVVTTGAMPLPLQVDQRRAKRAARGADGGAV